MLKRDLEQEFRPYNKEVDSFNKLRLQQKMLHNNSHVTTQEMYYTWHW
jgi:hypothetical protein